MKLQRYRINNCADIADDKGGYCLSEDVAKLESSQQIPTDKSPSKYDWRVLPQLKDKYVKSVFDQLEIGFPMSEASDHFITDIERFWFLKIDECVAVSMIIGSDSRDLNKLILVSELLDNENKWRSGYPPF